MSKQVDKSGKTPRLRLYTVRIGFVNPNADYEKPVYATSMWNAVWKATDSMQAHERVWGSVTHVNGRDVLTLR